MNRYYVTFGQKYRDEPHPLFDKAHPDGYVVIEASSMTKAREMVFKAFQTQWAFIYEEIHFQPYFFPKGVLLRLKEEP